MREASALPIRSRKPTNAARRPPTCGSLAERMQLGDAQTEIVELAERFERLAEYAERRLNA
jgi:HAMP domain-containing protein